MICLKENNSVFPTSRIVAGKSMVFRNTAEVKHCAERSHGSSDSIFITTLPLFHLYVFLKNNILFLAAQGLGCYVQAFSSCSEHDLLLRCLGFSPVDHGL